MSGYMIRDRVELRSARPGYTGSMTGTVIKIGYRLVHVEMDRPGNGARIRQVESWAIKKIDKGDRKDS